MSTESDAERIAREDRAIEEQGLEWRERSDAYLVGWVSVLRPGQLHTPAIVEIQRRQIEATRAFNMAADTWTRQSSVQTARVIELTVALRWLTFFLFVLGILQLTAAVAQVALALQWRS